VDLNAGLQPAQDQTGATVGICGVLIVVGNAIGDVVMLGGAPADGPGWPAFVSATKNITLQSGTDYKVFCQLKGGPFSFSPMQRLTVQFTKVTKPKSGGSLAVSSTVLGRQSLH
jgi:hypothetical protein